MLTVRVTAPEDGTIDPTEPAQESFPLLIAVAASLEDRVRLAELVDDVAPLLLVSGLDELRRLIAPAEPPPTPPDPEPAAEADAEPAAGTEPDRLARVADILTIDSARSVAQWHGREVTLTELEHDLLTQLNTEPLRVWTYQALHQTVWRNRHLRGTADVHSLVKRLRRKLDELGTTVTIDAVRGTGFRLTDRQRPSITGLRAC
jgi:DNA-binding winged helix-turn-helix (wHTH) protein